MIKKEDIITKLDQAKKSYADACERGNGLVAEYYEGVIDTLSELLIRWIQKMNRSPL